jgi:hypothetical protein
MAKCYVLKKDIDITFTPDEIFELIIICEGDKSYCKDAMSQYPKGSRGYTEYKHLFDRAERMQNKIIELRNANGVLEEV